MPKHAALLLAMWLVFLGFPPSAASEWESTPTTAQFSDTSGTLMLDCSIGFLVARLEVKQGALLGVVADEDEVELIFVADQGTPRQQSVSVRSDTVDRDGSGEVTYMVMSEKAKALADVAMRALDTIRVQVSHDNGVRLATIDVMVATATRAAPAMLTVIDNCKGKPAATTQSAPQPQPVTNPPADEGRWRVKTVAKGEVEAVVVVPGGHTMLGMTCKNGMFGLFYRVRRDQLEAAGQSSSSLSMFIVGADGEPTFAATRARTDDLEGFLRFEPASGVGRDQMIAWADVLRTGKVIKSGLARPGEGLEAVVASAEFGMEGLSEAEGTVRGACDAYLVGTPDAGVWTVYQADLGTPAIGISEGSATFALEAWDCGLTHISYRLPITELHPSLLNKTVDVTISRDGKDWELYLDAIDAKTEGSELVFSVQQAGADALLDLVAKAGRTVDIGLKGDNDAGPVVNLTRFLAKGSTAAVAELRKPCQSPSVPNPTIPTAAAEDSPPHPSIVRADDTFTRMSNCAQKTEEKKAWLKVAIAFTYGEELEYYEHGIEECKSPGLIVKSSLTQIIGHYKAYALELLAEIDTALVDAKALATWLQDFSATAEDLAAYMAQRDVSVCSTETDAIEAMLYDQFVYVDDVLEFIVSVGYYE